MCVLSCARCPYLFVDLICIQSFPVGISARVERAHKLVVVDEAVAVHVEDVRHCVHLQRVGGKFYSGEVWSQVIRVCVNLITPIWQGIRCLNKYIWEVMEVFSLTLRRQWNVWKRIINLFWITVKGWDFSDRWVKTLNWFMTSGSYWRQGHNRWTPSGWCVRPGLDRCCGTRLRSVTSYDWSTACNAFAKYWSRSLQILPSVQQLKTTQRLCWLLHKVMKFA